MNHYDILEVSASAPQSDIKSSYRRLVKRYHPDINPNEAAASKMILINEAYEVLSNVTSRNLYDLFLSGVPVKTDIEPERPEQRYREAYKAKRAKQEREKIIFLVKIKSRFYTYLRHANLLFFIIGFLFTVDYYFSSEENVLEVDKVIESRFQAWVLTKSGKNYSVGSSISEEFTETKSSSILVKNSIFLRTPAKIQVVGGEKLYPLHKTIYVFRNAFSIIILVFSAIVLKHREYTDFRLSCGLVPGFFILFLFLFVASEMV